MEGDLVAGPAVGQVGGEFGAAALADEVEAALHGADAAAAAEVADVGMHPHADGVVGVDHQTGRLLLELAGTVVGRVGAAGHAGWLDPIPVSGCDLHEGRVRQGDFTDRQRDRASACEAEETRHGATIPLVDIKWA